MPSSLLRSDLFADDTLKGTEFCRAYTDLVDEWLVELFVAGGGDDVDVSLVAVGGQGRREMAPQSDLDLLLLVGKGADGSGVADALWYPIWDAGLKLGHAVRTVRDTISLASEDLETATALLSARHVAGDPALTEELLEKALTGWRKRGRKWLDELSTSVRDRHAEAGEVAFDLEPDLKDGRGGLRDVHALSVGTSCRRRGGSAAARGAAASPRHPSRGARRAAPRHGPPGRPAPARRAGLGRGEAR